MLQACYVLKSTRSVRCLKNKKASSAELEAFCGNGWNRTNDTSIFSAVLYRLSYVTIFPGRLALGVAKVVNQN